MKITLSVRLQSIQRLHFYFHSSRLRVQSGFRFHVDRVERCNTDKCVECAMVECVMLSVMLDV